LFDKLMNRNKNNGRLLTEILSEEVKIQNFLDMICPTAIRFYTDYYIIGNTYRCVWAIREYPASTEEQAILRGFGEKDNITLKIYMKHLTPTEERKVIENANNKNRMNRADSGNVKGAVEAESNLSDVSSMVLNMHRNKEPLVFCSVFVEMTALSIERLKLLQDEMQAEMNRGKLNADRLLMKQKEGFISVNPIGYSAFKHQFDRVLPASSAANLYPFSYSGKTDNKGFYIGRDKGGTNIIIDLNKRTEDKTNSNILILGNSGQGKSYLMKLLLTNIRESGKKIISLDPDAEYADLTHKLGGCYIDLMRGEYIINVLEPKLFDDGSDDAADDYSPLDAEFKGKSQLRQHISFLKDFFKSYKPDFGSRHFDTLEIMLSRLYNEYKITDATDFSALQPADYPTLNNLYALIEHERKNCYDDMKEAYTADTLQELSLGLRSICIGNDSKFFDGHTNITSDRFITFGVKNLMNANEELKNAMLFNVLSYMSNALLAEGNAVASLDELYIFLTNRTVIEYIRNFMKRVRKKVSAVILASQNVEDFLQPGIAELTKPLFSIPTYQFLFNPGNMDMAEFARLLQLETSEWQLIKEPHFGLCLLKSGNERFHLEVHAPAYKSANFGTAGGMV